MSQNLPNTRVSNVAREITNAISGITNKDSGRRDARNVYTAASEDATSAREHFLIALASIAARDHWQLHEIDDGANAALAERNDKDTSIRTFTSEIKRACHPNARDHVEALSKLSNSVWETETEQNKKGLRPLRAAFARKYHLLQRMIGEAINGNIFSDSSEIIKWAVSLDPRHNPERMFKKFTQVRETLRELSDEFPVSVILNSVEKLEEVTVTDFKPDFRPAKRRPTPKSSAEPVDAREHLRGTQGAPEGEEPNTRPSEKVSDLLEEALRDIGAR